MIVISFLAQTKVACKRGYAIYSPSNGVLYNPVSGNMRPPRAATFNAPPIADWMDNEVWCNNKQSAINRAEWLKTNPYGNYYHAGTVPDAQVVKCTLAFGKYVIVPDTDDYDDEAFIANLITAGIISVKLPEHNISFDQ